MPENFPLGQDLLITPSLHTVLGHQSLSFLLSPPCHLYDLLENNFFLLEKAQALCHVTEGELALNIANTCEIKAKTYLQSQELTGHCSLNASSSISILGGPSRYTHAVTQSHTHIYTVINTCSEAHRGIHSYKHTFKCTQCIHTDKYTGRNRHTQS